MKNVFTAYILLLLLGGVGAHLLYLQRIPKLILFTLFLGMLYPPFYIVWLIVLLIDFVRIPEYVAEYNNGMDT